MFSTLEQILLSYASHTHLAIFSPVVSFIEELIPPIPSPSVMLATGSMAEIQDYTFYGLITLAILGAIGKTLGAIVVYFLADKVEDILSGRIAKFIGVTHQQIESFGNHLGNGARDYVVLTVLRALPIIPSALISIGSGLLKVNFRLFVVSALVGSIIRDYIYIYIGYIGTGVAISFLKNTATTIESYVQIIVVLVVVLILGYMYYRRAKKVN